MYVKEAMNKKVISIDINDNLSKALSRMKANNIHQLVVMKGKSIEGILELKSIITKDIDPSETKVSGFVKNVPFLDPEMDLIKAAEIMINTGVRALPVVLNGQVIGILSETDVIISASSELSKIDVKLKDLMTPCVYLDKEAKASKIQNLMFDTNVSRIPILENNNVIGVVGTLDLIKVLEAKSSPSQRTSKTIEKDAFEKTKTTDVVAETIMSKPIVLDENTSLSEALSFFKSNEEIIINGEKTGIITPKDVISLLMKRESKGIKVQLVGFENESVEFKSKTDSLLQKFNRKYSNIIEYLLIHLEKMQKQGKKQKYSIRIRLKTPFGFFVSHSWGWKELDVLQDAFDTIEKELKKKYQKEKDIKKIKKQKAKRR